MKRSVAIVVLLVTLPLLACSFSTGGGGDEPRLDTAVLCRELTADYAPVEPTEVFSSSEDFYISIEYFDLEEGQTIGVEWFLEDEFLYEASVTLDAANVGDGYAGFSLTNSELWPAGNYRADVYLDGELDHAVDLTVE
jgi:hypothetical protein